MRIWLFGLAECLAVEEHAIAIGKRQKQVCRCRFVNAAAEYQDREHPIHRRSCAYKAELQTHLRELLEQLAAPQPQQLARQLQYLLEGALSMAHIEGPGEQARDAKDAAQVLLSAAGL